MAKINLISSFIIPCIILFTSIIILISKKDYFSSFISGAKDGMISACKLLPTLCALIVSVSIFSASGASDFLCKICSPFFELLHIPASLLPLIITRPLSGGASLATFEQILSKCGVDSYEALCASLIMASSDTAIYVISVYFSTTQVRKTRHALPCALLISLISIFLSCAITKIFF